MKTKSDIEKRIFVPDVDNKQENALNLCEHLTQYFARSAGKDKKNYKLFRYSSIILASVVTILSFIFTNYELKTLKWILPIFTTFATVSATLLSITNAQTDWINNRTASQKFQSERFMFIQQVEKYANISDDERVKLFSEELIRIWNGVHSNWIEDKKEKK